MGNPGVIKSKSKKCTKTFSLRAARQISNDPNTLNNFMKALTAKHLDWSPSKIAVEGAKRWCRLTPMGKAKYNDYNILRSAVRTACCEKKRRRKKSCQKRKKSRCRRPKKRCSK